MHEHPLAAEILWFSPKLGHGLVTVELSMATPGRMGAFLYSPISLGFWGLYFNFFVSPVTSRFTTI
jgi:hypothetical protein